MLGVVVGWIKCGKGDRIKLLRWNLFGLKRASVLPFIIIVVYHQACWREELWRKRRKGLMEYNVECWQEMGMDWKMRGEGKKSWRRGLGSYTGCLLYRRIVVFVLELLFRIFTVFVFGKSVVGTVWKFTVCSWGMLLAWWIQLCTAAVAIAAIMLFRPADGDWWIWYFSCEPWSMY